jgi:Ser/Thr protein kinase RdoA (MazF antagonist)
MSSVFDRLEPQLILSAVEAAGFLTTGEMRQLNSYENRVFDISLEPSSTIEAPRGIDRVIAKFYRPARWSKSAIEDEHHFLRDLNSEGVSAVAPLILNNRKTILSYEGYEMALFPKVLGRMPQEFLPGDLQKVGRTLARIHNVGARQPAKNRISLDAYTYGFNMLPVIEKYIYPELWRPYREAAEEILSFLDENLDPAGYIRIHGDCHRGNLIHNGDEFLFVDFDDFCNGPPVQDFWMLLGGAKDDPETIAQQEEILTGYEELRDIPDNIYLIEALRGLRIISYAGWIGTRWTDSSFQRLFPQYTTYNYWAEELHQLQRLVHSL